MALAHIQEIETRKLVERSAQLGTFLLTRLAKLDTGPALAAEARGQGLLAGVEFKDKGKPATEFTLGLVKMLLRRGFIFLPEGEFANVLSFTPPLTISRAQLDSAVGAVQQCLGTVAREMHEE